MHNNTILAVLNSIKLLLHKDPRDYPYKEQQHLLLHFYKSLSTSKFSTWFSNQYKSSSSPCFCFIYLVQALVLSQEKRLKGEIMLSTLEL